MGVDVDEEVIKKVEEQQQEEIAAEIKGMLWVGLKRAVNQPVIEAESGKKKKKRWGSTGLDIQDKLTTYTKLFLQSEHFANIYCLVCDVLYR